MASRTGTRIPAELKKNFYSQKQKNPQKEFYSKHLSPYYRKGLEPPEELKTEFYEIALDLILQSLELDIRRMFHLVYSEIERRPHKRDILLKYACEEKSKIEQEMQVARKLYAGRPQIILLQKNALRNVKSTLSHIFI
jgi:hypothetical protein